MDECDLIKQAQQGNLQALVVIKIEVRLEKHAF